MPVIKTVMSTKDVIKRINEQGNEKPCPKLKRLLKEFEYCKSCFKCPFFCYCIATNDIDKIKENLRECGKI